MLLNYLVGKISPNFQLSATISHLVAFVIPHSWLWFVVLHSCSLLTKKQNMQSWRQLIIHLNLWVQSWLKLHYLCLFICESLIFFLLGIFNNLRFPFQTKLMISSYCIMRCNIHCTFFYWKGVFHEICFWKVILKFE